jgi:hypothetical protein
VDEARQAQRQIRAVLIGEKKRLEPLIQSGDAGQDRLDGLRERSRELVNAESAASSVARQPGIRACSRSSTSLAARLALRTDKSRLEGQ